MSIIIHKYYSTPRLLILQNLVINIIVSIIQAGWQQRLGFLVFIIPGRIKIVLNTKFTALIYASLKSELS